MTFMSQEDGVSRFAGNVSWLILGDAFAKIASFIFVVAVARGLSTTAYGQFNFATSFLPLFLVLAVWGLDDALFRDLARARERISELVATTFLLRLALAVVAVAAAIAIAPALVDGGQALGAFALVALALLFDELGSVLGTVFKAFERMRFRAIRIIVNRIVTTSLAIGVLVGGGDLIAVCAMYALGSFVAFLYAAYSLREHFPAVRFKDASQELAIAMLKKGTPLALAGVMSMAVFRIDAVMLQGMKGPVAVAMYGVAYRFLDSLLFVAWGLGNSILPRMTRAVDPLRRSRAAESVIALALTFYLPLAVGVLFAGNWVIETVFGARYSPAAEAVVWLMPATAVYGSAYIARMALLALEARRQIAWIAAIALAFNLIGNFLAIPRYGIEGAAAVTLLTGLIELCLLMFVFWGMTTFRLGAPLHVPLIASAVLGLTLWAMDADGASAAIVGAPVYLLTLAVILVLTPGDQRNSWRRALSPEAEAA